MVSALGDNLNRYRRSYVGINWLRIGEQIIYFRGARVVFYFNLAVGIHKYKRWLGLYKYHTNQRRDLYFPGVYCG